MSRFVRVTIHPAGMVTLMELDDDEGIIAVGIAGAGPYVVTAKDVTLEQSGDGTRGEIPGDVGRAN